MSKVEFGSVRFFKRVITITVALVIAVLALGLAVSWMKYRDVSDKLAKFEEQIVNASAESAQGDGISDGGSRRCRHSGNSYDNGAGKAENIPAHARHGVQYGNGGCDKRDS